MEHDSGQARPITLIKNILDIKRNGINSIGTFHWMKIKSSSRNICVFVCPSVPLQFIGAYTQTVRILVFSHYKDCITIISLRF